MKHLILEDIVGNRISDSFEQPLKKRSKPATSIDFQTVLITEK